MNPRQMTMVVARYHEDLDWLKQVSCNYVVYNKGVSLPEWVKNEIKLPNIGYEPHTYLTYIVDNYDNLSDYTVFVQGNPFEHSRNFIKKINDFDGGADFFPLVDMPISCVDGYGVPNAPGLRIAESARNLFLENNNMEFFKFAPGAQFIVSKKTIRFHTKMTYQKILNFLIKGESLPKEQAVNQEVAIFRIFSGKFPEGRQFFVPKTAILFHEKMIHQRVRDLLEGGEPPDEERIDIKHPGYRNLFSAPIMEYLWKTLFDNEHKTVYD